MKPFRERNPLPIGVAGFVLIALLLYVAFNAGNLPFISSGTTYHADFKDASGLQPQDEVAIAGVKVGQVTSVSLDGDMVRVGMKIDKGTSIGRSTTADVKIETLLGQMYVDLTPAGGGSLKSDIPLDRTTTPTDVVQAFTGLGQRAGNIDSAELAKSFDVIAKTFSKTPPYVHSSLVGLERLSQTVASRNAALSALLADAHSVTGTLASHDAQVTQLINSSNQILTTISQQRATIHKLLVNTIAVSQQLTGLVHDNQKVLGPALANLKGTEAILNANQKNLSDILYNEAPFLRDFTDILGNGRWFETVVSNLGPQLLPTSCASLGGTKLCPPSLGGSTGTGSGAGSGLGGLLGGSSTGSGSSGGTS